MDPGGGSIVLEVLTLVVLLLFSALFSASETAFFSLNRLRIERLAIAGDRTAKAVYDFLQNPAELIATILIGNEIVNIAISSTAALLFMDIFGREGSIYAVPSTVVILLIFGEVTPKTFAVKYSERYALFIVRFLKFVSFLLAPVRAMLISFVSFLLKPFGVELFSEQKVISDEEFMILVEEGAREGIIAKEEKDLIDRTLDLDESDVKEIMVPKHEVFALPADITVKEALARIKEKRFSRIPVYGKDLDDIKGILYTRRIIPLQLKKEDFEKPVQEFIDRPFFVPEFKEIDDLLEEMQRKKKHLAIVVDEYGNTAGIVTLDDILSSLIGEIPDERQSEEKDFEKIGNKKYRVNPSVSIEDFKEFFGIDDVTEEEKDVDTVGGLVMKLLDRIPAAGDTVEWNGLKLKVEKMDGNRIKSVVVERM
ncbi:hemolysin family protein [Desulfurobacterium sp.]